MGSLSVEALGELGRAVLFTITGKAMLMFICWVEIERLHRCRIRASPCRTEQKPETKGTDSLIKGCFCPTLPKSGPERRLQSICEAEMQRAEVTL